MNRTAITPPPPVYLLSSERSGTNLLRRQLMAWQTKIFGPAPTHTLKVLQRYVPFYGPLTNDENFKSLIKDVLSLCYQHFAPWDHQFEVHEVLEGYAESLGEHRSLIRLVDHLNRAYASVHGFQTYLCKDNHLFDFAFQILSDIPNVRFVYLHRDPRDYVLSQKKRLLSTSSITRAAKLWKCEQLKCIEIANSPQFAHRCHWLSYEHLIADEETAMSDLCRFLDVPIEKRTATYNDPNCSGTDDWKNLSKPVMRENSQKYKQGLRRSAVKAIEAIAWEPLRYLGYQPENEGRPVLSAYYRRIEPFSALAWDVAKRPFMIRRDGLGRAKRVSAVREIHAKF